MQADAEHPDVQLAEEIARFYADPLGFVIFGYPWDTDPALQLVELRGEWAERFPNCKYGPDEWACELLDDIGRQVKENGFDGFNAVKAIREAIASGHGIGKSAITAWIVNWIMSTRPFAQGTVTANTAPQLETKTWAQIAKWTKLCVTAHWFEVTTGRGSMKMYHKDYKESWFCSAQTCKEENSESFAGQHAANSTSFYIFDEASAVPDKIWEVAEGGLTDGEPMMFAFGNPTRSSGKFREIFNRLRHRWGTRQIDSRSVQITNKAQIDEWIEDYGIDSDFVRIRVLGKFPRASEMQFIPSDLVAEAMRREPVSYLSDPLIMSLDIARGGTDKNVFRFRRGLDARSIPPVKIPGELTRDSMRLVAKAVDLLDTHKPDMFFLDGTGVGGPIGDRIRQLGYRVVIVNFGDASPDPKYANMRAYIYGKLKEWLYAGGALDDDPDMEEELTNILFTHDSKDRVLLEKKEKIKDALGRSPDDADAEALLHAMPVAPKRAGGTHTGVNAEYNYLDNP